MPLLNFLKKISIDVFSIVKFLYENRSEVIYDEAIKAYTEKY